MAKGKKSISLMQAVKLPIYLVIAWLLGFGFFLLNLPPTPTLESMNRSDAIVVLTGGAGRLDAGLKLLEAKIAERMLISGVHPDVEPHELSALTGTEEALFACCIDLDRTSPNTAGNAAETATWADDQKYQSLILVTADYHIPRSLILFRRAMPRVSVTPFPVKGEWPLAMLAQEYSKYLVTVVGEALHDSPTSDLSPSTMSESNHD